MTALSTSVVPHVLRVADLDARRFSALLDLAAAMKRHPLAWRSTLEGRAVACHFARPSTRTRVSFEAAINRLGGLPIMLRPDELQLGRGEPIADTARVLSSYCEAIVIRTLSQRDVREVAEYSSVPVINALTDDHHPCQALADCLTLREHFGSLDGLTLAYVGDGGNVAHSLIEAAHLTGMTLRLATPPGFLPDPSILAAAGRSVRILDTPDEAVAGADAVYYRTTRDPMASARHDAAFLHCRPAHGGETSDSDVIDGPASLVWAQVANRLPTEQAVLSALITGDWEV